MTRITVFGCPSSALPNSIAGGCRRQSSSLVARLRSIPRLQQASNARISPARSCSSDARPKDAPRLPSSARRSLRRRSQAYGQRHVRPTLRLLPNRNASSRVFGWRACPNNVNCQSSNKTAAAGGKAGSICSRGVSRILTQLRHRAPFLALARRKEGYGRTIPLADLDCRRYLEPTIIEISAVSASVRISRKPVSLIQLEQSAAVNVEPLSVAMNIARLARRPGKFTRRYR